MKIILCAGTRPNFMKIAPIYHEAKKRNHEVLIIHSGQHYDTNMSSSIIKQLGMPDLDVNLNLKGGERDELVAEIAKQSSEYFKKMKPEFIFTVGDVNSTLGFTKGAKDSEILVAHVEAGLRSSDERMPEEANRIEIDKIADYKFITEEDAITNLQNEGIYSEKDTFFVGNVMIDSLINNEKKITDSKIPEEIIKNINGRDYVVVTLHRPSNIDNKKRLGEFVSLLNYLSKQVAVLFPMHPRTERVLKENNLYDDLTEVIKIGPLAYFEFLNLVKGSKFIFTDSGGLQDETTYLKIPCITMRANTERPVTITKGTSFLAGEDIRLAKFYVDCVLRGALDKEVQDIPLWDGKASERILDIVEKIVN